MCIFVICTSFSRCGVESKSGKILPAVRLYCIKQGDAEEKGPFTFSQVQNMWRAGSVKVTDKMFFGIVGFTFQNRSASSGCASSSAYVL